MGPLHGRICRAPALRRYVCRPTRILEPVKDRYRRIYRDNHACKVSAEQPCARFRPAYLEHAAGEQDREAQEEPDIRACQQSVGADCLWFHLGLRRTPMRLAREIGAPIEAADPFLWSSLPWQRPRRVTQPEARNNTRRRECEQYVWMPGMQPDHGCPGDPGNSQAEHQRQPCLTTPSPPSTQDIRAAPAGTQAISSAPARADPCPGMRRTRTSAAMLVAIPARAVSSVRVQPVEEMAGGWLTEDLTLVSLNATSARVDRNTER